MWRHMMTHCSLFITVYNNVVLRCVCLCYYLNCRKQVFGTVINPWYDITEALRVGGPQNYNLVHAARWAEVSYVVSDLFHLENREGRLSDIGDTVCFNASKQVGKVCGITCSAMVPLRTLSARLSWFAAMKSGMYMDGLGVMQRMYGSSCSCKFQSNTWALSMALPRSIEEISQPGGEKKHTFK